MLMELNDECVYELLLEQLNRGFISKISDDPDVRRAELALQAYTYGHVEVNIIDAWLDSENRNWRYTDSGVRVPR